MVRLVLVCISLMILLSACTDNKQSVISYYDSGAKIKKEEFTIIKKTGVKDGKYTAYFENGKVKVVAYYVQGSLQDTMKKYTDSGILEEFLIYKNNRQNGPRVAYYNNGKIKAIENYTDDMFDGPYQSFYENGSKDEVGQFSKNIKTGRWVYYYENDTKLGEYTFGGSDNLENGPYVKYFRNGKPDESGNMKSGMEVGTVTFYDSITGKVIKKQDFDETGRPIMKK